MLPSPASCLPYMVVHTFIFQAFTPLLCLKAINHTHVLQENTDSESIWRIFFSSMVSLPKVQQLFGIGQNCSYKALLELAKKSKVSHSRDISTQEQATFFLYVCVGTLKSESHYGLIIVWRGCAPHRFPVTCFLVWSNLLLPYLWAGCVFTISQCLSLFL